LEKEKEPILAEYHDSLFGGHFGRDVTLSRIREKFWWPTMWRDVAEYVKTCDSCQRYGPLERRNALNPFRPIAPFEFLFIDFMINLPRTARQKRHIITATEGLTKWLEAKAVRSATSKEAASFLMDIIFRFGPPLAVITDNGSHFHGEFDELCKKLHIHHRFATPYHPQTNGQDERSHQVLLDRIRRWRLEDQDKWDLDLAASVAACNSRRVSTTGFTPREALLGYTAPSISELERLQKESRTERIIVAQTAGAKELKDRLEVLEAIRDEAIEAKDRRIEEWKERYDGKIRSRDLNVGDEVLLHDTSTANDMSGKLLPKWQGPYKILWKGNQGAYRIELAPGTIRQVSGDRIKPYHRRLEGLDTH
jgi:hypothetical protein